jgi:hypothetical protein
MRKAVAVAGVLAAIVPQLDLRYLCQPHTQSQLEQAVLVVQIMLG